MGERTTVGHLLLIFAITALQLLPFPVIMSRCIHHVCETFSPTENRYIASWYSISKNSIRSVCGCTQYISPGHCNQNS